MKLRQANKIGYLYIDENKQINIHFKGQRINWKPLTIHNAYCILMKHRKSRLRVIAGPWNQISDWCEKLIKQYGPEK